MEWSRSFFPKVFGGVFAGSLLAGVVFAGSSIEQAAISKATEATLQATGISAKIKQRQAELERVLMGYAKEYDIQDEIAVLGLVAKTTRDKRVSFRYKGNTYMVCPNYIEIKIPF